MLQKPPFLTVHVTSLWSVCDRRLLVTDSMLHLNVVTNISVRLARARANVMVPGPGWYNRWWWWWYECTTTIMVTLQPDMVQNCGFTLTFTISLVYSTSFPINSSTLKITKLYNIILNKKFSHLLIDWWRLYVISAECCRRLLLNCRGDVHYCTVYCTILTGRLMVQNN